MTKYLSVRAKFVVTLTVMILSPGSFHPLCTAAETVITGTTMGSIIYRVSVNSDAELPFEEIQDDIDLRLGEVNRQMSTWDPESELSQFNRSDSTEWFPVSEELALVVERSLSISRRTEGAFDITVGPLVNLWSFGPNGAATSSPTDSQINDALAKTGYQHLKVQSEPPALKKDITGLYVDLFCDRQGLCRRYRLRSC